MAWRLDNACCFLSAHYITISLVATLVQGRIWKNLCAYFFSLATCGFVSLLWTLFSFTFTIFWTFFMGDFRPNYPHAGASIQWFSHRFLLSAAMFIVPYRVYVIGSVYAIQGQIKRLWWVINLIGLSLSLSFVLFLNMANGSRGPLPTPAPRIIESANFTSLS